MAIDIAKQRILSRVPLEDLIGEKIALTSRSGRKVGLCPFHAEKSPSFTIFDDHYFCFGCRARGDAIDFVRQQNGLSFIESLRYLAEKYGIEIPEMEQSQKERQQHQKISQSFRMLALAQQRFVTQLESPAGLKAREYLHQRGYNDEQIKDYGFGLALDQPQGMLHALEQSGFPVSEQIQGSLASPSKSGRVYDFFQNRLMIPIQDKHGRVIAFGGRTMGDDPAKYKNSRETELFDKGRTLFGIHRAMDSMRRTQSAIVVEGYMDAMQLWNFGFTQTVACLGTALTTEHLRQISQFASTVYVVFDGDFAGQQASLRTVNHALEVPKVAVKVVPLPGNDDPDTFLVSHGKEAFSRLLQNAQDLLDYAITANIGQTHELGKPDLIKQKFVPWLLAVTDRVQRSFLVRRIAKLADIPSETIEELLGKPRSKAAEKPIKPEPVAEAPVLLPRQPLTPLEFEVLGQLLFAQSGEIDTNQAQQLIHDDFTWDEVWNELADEMIGFLNADRSPHTVPLGEWNVAAEPRVTQLLQNLLGKPLAFQVKNRQAALNQLFMKRREDSIRSSVALLKRKLTQASPALVAEESRAILTAIHELNRELSELASKSKT